MKAALALMLTVLLLPLAGAQASYQPVGDLFITADNTLAPQPGGTSTPCLTIAGPNAQPQTAEFAAELAEGDYVVAPGNLTLLVALDGANGPAQSGSGFTLAGELAFGSATPLAAQQDFGPAQSTSGGSLSFALPGELAASGPILLTLTLAPAGGALPVGLAQDVRLLCDHENSRLSSFNLQGQLALPEEDDHAGEGLALPGPVVFGIAILAGLATLAAGLLALAGRTISERRVHLLLGITAGLLLAIALIDLVPEAIELEENAVFTLAFGILGLFIIKWVSGSHSHGHGNAHAHDAHAHDHPHIQAKSGVARLALLAFFALGFHRLVDGVVLPAGFEIGGTTGFAAAGAILAHQFPDGIAGASVFLAAGWSRKRVALGVGVLAALTPVGTLLGLTVLGLAGLIGHLIALAAATFIFIALAELLPELGSPQFRRVVLIGVVIGYAAALGLEYIASLFGGH